jgi:DNA-binding PucR family transcriptional regulator
MAGEVVRCHVEIVNAVIVRISDTEVAKVNPFLHVVIGKRLFQQFEPLSPIDVRIRGVAPAARRSADLPVTALLTQPAVRDAVASSTNGPLSALRGGDLMETLASFLTHHGSWDRTAADLGVHRHTVRHRIRRVEELSGLRLDDPEDRLLLHLGVLADPGRR